MADITAIGLEGGRPSSPTLLDRLAVVRTWGRLGGWSRSLATPVADDASEYPEGYEAEAQRLAEKLVQRKIKRGYKIIQPKGEKPMTNPNLTKHLEVLADLANQIGAQGIWLIRGATDARLNYAPAGEVEQPDIPGVEITTSLSLALGIADAGVLMIMRFPAGDGGEPGIESR